MKTFRMLTLTAVLLALLALAVVPTFAQSSRTVTMTEADVNALYRVTNPVRRSLSNVYVDLQPGQVQITATMAFRRAGAMNVVAVLTPSVSNGRVNWTLISASVNGVAATSDQIAQVNSAISSSWRSWFRSQLGTGRVTSITITDSDASIVLTTGR